MIECKRCGQLTGDPFNHAKSCTGRTAPPSPWRPIDTAPRDGTEILVWREDQGVSLAQWISPVELMSDGEIAQYEGADWLEESDWFYADFLQGGRLDDPPTHWMPVPDGPNAEKEAADAM